MFFDPKKNPFTSYHTDKGSTRTSTRQMQAHEAYFLLFVPLSTITLKKKDKNKTKQQNRLFVSQIIKRNGKIKTKKEANSNAS